MKAFLIIGVMGLLLFSCKKEKSYFPFTEKQLVFVNYSKGQSLKFIDSASVVQTLEQYQFRREFREPVGLFGKTGFLLEEYEVAYSARGNSNLGLYINLNAKEPYLHISFANIKFASYQAMVMPDSLHYTFPSLTVNGKVYPEVYTIKVYKDGQYLNNTDTATLFHSKGSGVIQLLFPNGKKIVRTD